MQKLFFVVTGLRRIGKSSLYRELETGLKFRLGPEIAVAFVGSPFSKDELPFPARPGERGCENSARWELRRRWSQLLDFVDEEVVPAFAEHDVVVADGFGLDAYLHAAALTLSESELEEVDSLHHQHYVPKELRARLDICMPTYLVLTTSEDTAVELMAASSPRFAELPSDEQRKSVHQADRAIDRYFEESHGQNRPTLIDIGAGSSRFANVVQFTIGAIESATLPQAA